MKIMSLMLAGAIGLNVFFKTGEWFISTLVLLACLFVFKAFAYALGKKL